MSQDFDQQFLNRKKQGFVFDLENWVFNNINLIDDNFKDGGLIYSINSQILRKLSRNKSRTNALRLWKLLVIENYLNENEKIIQDSLRYTHKKFYKRLFLKR